jgi:hypothetical protein
MESKSSRKLVIFVLSVALTFLLSLVYIAGIRRTKTISEGEPTLEKEVIDDSQEKDSSISEYFEESFSGDGDFNESLVNGDDLCELDGQMVKEGTVKFGTTCVKEPQRE